MQVLFFSRLSQKFWTEALPPELTEKEGITFDFYGNAVNFWLVTDNIDVGKEILKKQISEYENLF